MARKKGREFSTCSSFLLVPYMFLLTLPITIHFDMMSNYSLLSKLRSIVDNVMIHPGREIRTYSLHSSYLPHTFPINVVLTHVPNDISKK